ncbi:MAG: beta-propeller fold lactonase family protein [Terracidiphilus sp.]|jgi:6-phosphogluconolactonase (cycloisomerase 2 family)
MKFRKFGKALLLSALSAGVILSVTSCVESYSVGYLYVTGTVTAQSSSSGIISGFKIDHNTGKLTPINGLPVPSGGANPVRAVLLTGSRFLYVLNRGVPQSGQTECTTLFPCLNANITQFAIGANGILTPQETFYTQGVNPFRMIADSSGSFIYVLDHDSPTPASTSSAPVADQNNANCAAALTGAITCGDITAFTVNATTGRLTLLQNTQVTTAGGTGSNLTYFPVPANPVDFVLSSGILLTMSSAQTTVDSTTLAYTGGSSVFPYTYNASNGQLTVNQNSAQPLNILQGTALVSGSSYVFVLDNEPPAAPNSTNATSQILTFTTGSGGSLASVTNGIIPDDPNQSNPTWLAVESKGKWLYVANQGNNATNTGTAESGLAGYVLNSPFQPTEMSGTPVGFGVGAGPQCLVEDPTNQFFYTANFYSSTVTGQAIDQNAGTLTPLSQVSKVPASYALTGQPTWCLVDGRTN